MNRSGDAAFPSSYVRRASCQPATLDVDTLLEYLQHLMHRRDTLMRKIIPLLAALLFCSASVAQAQRDGSTRQPQEPEPQAEVDSVIPETPAPVGRVCVTAVNSCNVGPGPRGAVCHCGQASGRTQ
jgi:hypothetical protein